MGVVLHRGAVARMDLAPLLGLKTALRVMEPRDSEKIEHGAMYVAPSDRHMRFEAGVIRLDDGKKQHHTRPAIDPLFASAAREYGHRAIGVVLSGCSRDGVAGLIAVKAAGGMSVVQEPLEARFPDMPMNAIIGDHVDAVLHVDRMGETLGRLARGEAVKVTRSACP